MEREYVIDNLLVLIHSREREFFIDNLLVRIHFIIVMMRWTGLTPWEFEFPFPGFLLHGAHHALGKTRQPVKRHWSNVKRSCVTSLVKYSGRKLPSELGGFARGQCSARGGLFTENRNVDLYQLMSYQRALPAEIKVESRTSQSKSGTSVNLSNRVDRQRSPSTPAFRFSSGYEPCEDHRL